MYARACWQTVCLLFFLIAIVGCNINDVQKRHAISSIDSLMAIADSTTLPVSTKINALRQVIVKSSAEKKTPALLAATRKLAVFYLKADSADKALLHLKEALQYARILKDREQEAIVLNNIGIVFNGLSRYDSAVLYYSSADTIFHALNNNLRVAQGMVNVAIVYKNMGDYEAAYEKTIKAVELLKKQSPSLDIASAYTNLGNVLKDIHRYNEAIVYHQQAIEIRYVYGDTAGIGSSLNNIGNVYKHKQHYTDALQYYLGALDLMKNGVLSQKLTVLDNITECYLATRQYHRAEQIISDVFRYRNTINDVEGYITSSHNLAKLLLTNGRYQEAEHVLLETERELSVVAAPKLKLENTLLIEQVQELKNNCKEAIASANRALALKDSIFDGDMAAKVLQLETAYQTKDKENQLALSKQQQKEQRKEIDAQKRYIFFFYSVIVLLLIIMYLMLRLSRQRRLAKENVELLMSELNHRVKNNLQVINSILQLQIDSSEDKKLQDMLHSSKKRVDAIWIIHELLQTQSYSDTIYIKTFIEALLQNIVRAYDADNSVEIAAEIEDITFDVNTSIPIGLIINELITNIIKYGIPQGEGIVIKVSLALSNSKYTLRVKDNCNPWIVNVTEDSRNGLGLHLVALLIEQLDGEQTTSYDIGTCQQIIF